MISASITFVKKEPETSGDRSGGLGRPLSPRDHSTPLPQGSVSRSRRRARPKPWPVFTLAASTEIVIPSSPLVPGASAVPVPYLAGDAKIPARSLLVGAEYRNSHYTSTFPLMAQG
jgi:hypothetical protein